jgi:hypothetical protein
LDKQALLRKDSRGAEAKNVCTKLEEVLEGETKLTTTTTLPTADPASPDLLMKVPAFPNELCAEPLPLGSTQKMTAVKANKTQQDQLGSELVATPVRRSCRKASKTSKSDALQSSGFAFTPNKFIPSDNKQSEDAEFEFNADANADTEEPSQATPTFNLGAEAEAEEMQESQESYAQRMLTVNTPNYPRLLKQNFKMKQKTAIGPIAKVLATLLNNSAKEEAKVESKAAPAPVWNSPRRTKKFLFDESKAKASNGPSLRMLKKTLREEMHKKNLREAKPNEEPQQEQKKKSQMVFISPQLTIAGGKSVSNSLMFAREVQNDGSIDHKVGVTSISSQVLSVEDCTENSLPVQEMEQLNSFHSGLTPKKMPKDTSAADALLKSPVAVKVRHFDSLAAEKEEKEEEEATAATLEEVSVEEAPQSILKSTPKAKKSKSVQKKKKKSVSFGTQLEQPLVQGEEAPVKRATRATRASSRKAVVEKKEESPAAPAAAADSSTKVEEEVIDYTKMTVVNLKALLKAKGLPVSGRKAELIERLTSSGPTDTKPVEAKKPATGRVTRSTRSSSRNKK